LCSSYNTDNGANASDDTVYDTSAYHTYHVCATDETVHNHSIADHQSDHRDNKAAEG
jgi:hypothetical protein